MESCSGYLLVSNRIRCNIGRHANDENWISDMSGETVETMFHKLLETCDDEWCCSHGKFLSTFIRIVWTNKDTGEVDEEYYTPTHEEYKNFGLLHNNFGFASNYLYCVSEDEYLIDFCFTRDNVELNDIRGWWNALNNMFEVKSGIFTFIDDNGYRFVKKEGKKCNFDQLVKKLNKNNDRTQIKDPS